MKNLNHFKKTIAALSIFILSMTALSQWESDLRLTTDPQYSWTSQNNAWCVASNGNFVHVIWEDNRDNNSEVYYKRSIDGGVNWEPDTRLSYHPALSAYPSISASGLFVHTVWYDNRDGNEEIYYKGSTDNGTSWSEDIRLTNSAGFSKFPSIRSNGLFVHTVWWDDRDGIQEIYYKRSTDGGLTWGTDIRLSETLGSSAVPSVTVAGQIVHVVWMDSSDGNWEIYHRSSTSDGTSWGTVNRLTDNFAPSAYCSVTASELDVHVVWVDYRHGNPEVYYKLSADGGNIWGTDTRLTFNSAASLMPSIAASGSNLHVVWEEHRDGNAEIYYINSVDAGGSWLDFSRLTNNLAGSFWPSVSVSDSVIHVVWMDQRDGGIEQVYYKRNPTGNLIGITQINSEIPVGYRLSQNYPNPFNPSTKISFALPKADHVKLVVFDVLGREAAILVNQFMNAGQWDVDFNAAGLTSGVYFYRLETGSFTETKKMLLIK
jgi:hypothetical protein